MKPVLHVLNWVERGTLTSQGAIPGAPVSRLGDGDVGLFWQDSASGASRTVTLDAGVSAGLSSMVLAAGHNLTGVVCSLETGPTSSGPWTALASVTPSSTAAARVVFAYTSARYWRLVIVGPGAAPRLSEWALAYAVVLPSGPQEPSLVVGPLGNVQVIESPGGYAWTRKRGPSRWEGDYLIRDLKLDEKTALEQAYAWTDEGARAFFLEDADGILRWVYWITEGGKLNFQAEGITRWRVLLQFREGL